MNLQTPTSQRKICVSCGRRTATSASRCPQDDGQLRVLRSREVRDAKIGRVFADRYRLTGILGAGGMGTVYRAVQLDFNRSVAIKILKGRPAPNSSETRRFHREAETLAQLQHPHVVRLFDFGQTKRGRLYMVMELLEGESLAERLWREGLSYRDIFDLVMPVCDALTEAHAHQIIHRDLKTQNIFILSIPQCNQMFAKLLDFGIAKQMTRDTLTKTGWLCGTPAYMSPEMILGDPVTGASDLYSMGVLLYDLIAGTLPFTETSYVKLANAHLYREPKPLRQLPGLGEVPSALDELVLKLLAKDSHDRVESMPELYRRLREIRDDDFNARKLDTTPAFKRFSATPISDTLVDRPWAEALRANSGESVDDSADSAFISHLQNVAADGSNDAKNNLPEWIEAIPRSDSSDKVHKISTSQLERIRRGPQAFDTAQLVAIVGPERAAEIRGEKPRPTQQIDRGQAPEPKNDAQRAPQPSNMPPLPWLIGAALAGVVVALTIVYLLI